ncbi:COG4223 family protein [Defluviimonas salinarum]|uniref:Mitochondrial inner membrane protein n=1 Tax=Defluviimonas salinarum TaxID=2992147 RepID=A0ABT3J1I2_9RHOB|nr:hypothetical protein [Defluviimonas salinarum]MCW3781530.1 hypothetical protein [Defluviimonas salinarum]
MARARKKTSGNDAKPAETEGQAEASTESSAEETTAPLEPAAEESPQADISEPPALDEETAVENTPEVEAESETETDTAPDKDETDPPKEPAVTSVYDETGFDASDTRAEASTDTTAEVEPERTAAAITPSGSESASTPARGGFLPLVLGGVVAAGLGFGAATYVLPQFLTAPQSGEELAALTELLRQQEARISALSDEITAIASDPAAAQAAEAQAARAAKLAQDFDAFRQTVSALDDRLVNEAQRIGALDTRLAAIEKRPVASGAASATALEAFDRDMAQMRSEIEAQRKANEAAREEIAAAAEAAAARFAAAEEDARRLREEAESVALQASARAALSRIQTALDTGATLNGSLSELAAAGVEVPQELTDQSLGVPTLAALRDAFPPAARDALAVSIKATAGGGTMDRIGAFLRSQSGARSLSPRAGDDPDAVLSRAEAALGAGDLAAAIGELKGLPEDGLARMAEWIARAERRIAAEAAVTSIGNALE